MLHSIKVLVVDDSALMRRVITRMLEAQPDIQVLDTAADGEEAIKKTMQLRPDVVTMDVEMPGLNGVETVKRMMLQCPVPVIMLSAHTTEGARVTMEALAAGAVDFVPKPVKPGGAEKMALELTRKIRVARRVLVHRCKAPTEFQPAEAKPIERHPIEQHPAERRPAERRPVDRPPTKSKPVEARPLESKTDARTPAQSPRTMLTPVPTGEREPIKPLELVVIGSSTGGPAALQNLLPFLPANFPCGIVVVQHIPVGFSGPMAEHLNRKCQVEVKHAEQGDRVMPGRVLVAPAGYDLYFRRYGDRLSVALDKGSKPVPPGGFRPSVDVVMNSAAEVMANRTLAVLLTGMGRDGARGMLAVRQGGGRTIAQDESTSVVYGMPKAAADIGAAERILPLERIAGEMIRLV